MGNDAGEIAVFSNTIEILTIVTIPEFSIEVIYPFSKGFIAGSNHGRITIVPANESEDEADPFGSPKSTTISSEIGTVKSISLSVPSEESLIVALDDS